MRYAIDKELNILWIESEGKFYEFAGNYFKPSDFLICKPENYGPNANCDLPLSKFKELTCNTQ